jgi:hypothetical protein
MESARRVEEDRIVGRVQGKVAFITGTTQVVDAGATAPFKIPHG